MPALDKRLAQLEIEAEKAATVRQAREQLERHAKAAWIAGEIFRRLGLTPQTQENVAVLLRVLTQWRDINVKRKDRAAVKLVDGLLANAETCKKQLQVRTAQSA